MMTAFCKDESPRHMRKHKWPVQPMKANKCYYLAFGIYSVISWINLTAFHFSGFEGGEIAEHLIQMIVLVLLACSFILKKASAAQRRVNVAVIAASFVVWRVSAEGWLFWTCLFIMCAPEFNVRKLSKITSLSVLCVLLASTIAVVSGFIPMMTVIRSDNGCLRNALGFLHPNNLGLAMSVLSIAFCVYRFENFQLLYLILYALAAVFVYLVPVSKTASISIIFVPLFWAFIISMQKRGRRSTASAVAFSIYMLVLLSSLTMMLVCNDSGIITDILNKLLSGRPYFARQYYDASGIRILGNSFANGPVQIVDGKEVNFLVDNAVDHVLLRYGLFSFVMLFGAIAMLYYRSLRQCVDMTIVCGMTCFMVMGITESFACRVECNYLLISLAFIFWQQETLCKSETKSPELISKTCNLLHAKDENA